MSWETFLHAAVLFASAALAIWAFVVIRGRPDAPGGAALGGLMLAVAHWCLTSGLHATIVSIETRIALSQIQYVGICAAPPLWMLFAGQYARLRWTADRMLRSALWIVPIATLILALTNGAHGLLWADVVPVDGTFGARLRYVHGPWFWVALSFNYFCLAGGTITLLRAIGRSPVAPWQQMALVIVGIALPWLGNVLYLAGVLPAGFDPTPVAFTLTGVCILWGLYRHRLLTLVPIARDLVIDSMDAGVFMLDPRYAIVDFNPAARRLTGCTEESAGQSIEHIVPWWRQAAAGGRLAAGAPVVVDLGSSSLEVQMTAVSDSHETCAGWLVMMRDIAERRAAEVERQALERRVQEQQRAESLTVLTAGVAHDFNNLLTGILGNAELVAIEAAPGSSMRANAHAILLGAQRAADLVDKLLAYAGQRQAAPEPVDLDELVRDMGALLQASLGRHCTINYEGPDALPPVTGDPTQLRQVLLNLVTNAAEASDPGSTIVVATGVEALTEDTIGSLTFESDLSPGSCAFLEVTDSGRGIDETTLTRVFDPFFSTKAHGRGLGLAAVQGIVRSHGGGLRITSAPGSGTGVKIWLPLEAAGS